MDIDQIVADAGLGAGFPLDSQLPFTRAQARAAGISRHTLDLLTAAGILRKPIRGVFIATELGDSLSLRAECLRLVARPGAVIVDRHAGWLHGATMVLPAPVSKPRNPGLGSGESLHRLRGFETLAAQAQRAQRREGRY